MPEQIVTPAIVLRAVATGESDRVVTLLGRSTGKIAAIARGARKSARRFSGGFGLGASGEAVLRDRPGADLALLETFEVLRDRQSFGSDLARTAHAGYVLELSSELCGPRQPEPAVYDWLDGFLDALEARGASASRLRAFELGLLGRLGLAPALTACVGCGRSDLGGDVVRLDLDRGGITCPACARRGTLVQPGVRRVLATLAAATLADAEAVTLDRDDAAATRGVVAELLGTHLTRPLKSLEFLRKLQGA